MTDPTIDQKLADLTGELLGLAAKYDGKPLPAAAETLALALKNGDTSRDDLCNALATIAIQLRRDRTPMFAGQPITEAARRLNVTGRILSIIAGFGGERLVADNPAMHRMVEQLSDEAEHLGRDGFLPRTSRQSTTNDEGAKP